MLASLVVGIAAGFVLAIPPGPIAVAVIKQALEGKEKYGLKLGLGASAMDILFSFIAAFASSTIVVALRTAITGNGWYLLVFQVVSIAALVILAIRYLKPNAHAVEETARKEAAQEMRAQRLGYTSPYLVGVAIALTNLASPTFLPSLIFIVGILQAHGWVGYGISEQAFYAIGFGSGSAAWFLILLKSLVRLRSRISPNFMTAIFRFAAGSFFLFAGILLYNVVVTTDWSHLPGL